MDAVNRLPGHPPTPPIDYQHCPNPTLPGGNGYGGSPASAGSAIANASGQTATGATAGATTTTAGNVASELPPGSVQVTVLSAASRARLLSQALANAARNRGPGRTPLWIALLLLVLIVFTPLVAASIAESRRRKHVE
jgi:hypothetical protein